MAEAGDAIVGEEILLEEVEVLPYESVFDWTLQDPLGYYKENERYLALKNQFKSEELKLLVIEEMWKDRAKYHALRRFTWPPKTKVGMFYTRGYYEDYDSRPTIDLNTVTDKPIFENQTKRTAGYKKLKQQIYLNIMEEDEKAGKGKKQEIVPIQDKVVQMVEVPTTDNPVNAPVTVVQVIEANPIEAANNNTMVLLDVDESGKKKKKKDKGGDAGGLKDWNSYSPIEYNKLKLNLKKIPEGTNAGHLEAMMQGGTVLMKGKKAATVTFNTPEEAEAAFKAMQTAEVNGKVMSVEPKPAGEPDDDTAAGGGAADGGKAKKKEKKAKKKKTAEEVETIEEVSYEVVKKPKDPNRKKNKKKNKEAKEGGEVTDAAGADAKAKEGDEGGKKKKKDKTVTTTTETVVTEGEEPKKPKKKKA